MSNKRPNPLDHLFQPASPERQSKRAILPVLTRGDPETSRRYAELAVAHKERRSTNPTRLSLWKRGAAR